MVKIVKIIGVLVFLLTVSSAAWAGGNGSTTTPTSTPTTTTTVIPTSSWADFRRADNASMATHTPTPSVYQRFREADAASMKTLPPANCQYDGKTLPNGKPEIMCTLKLNPAPTRPQPQVLYLQQPTPQSPESFGGCAAMEEIITITTATPTKPTTPPPASHKYGAQDSQ
jgi:hypothetical protein